MSLGNASARNEEQYKAKGKIKEWRGKRRKEEGKRQRIVEKAGSNLPHFSPGIFSNDSFPPLPPHPLHASTPTPSLPLHTPSQPPLSPLECYIAFIVALVGLARLWPRGLRSVRGGGCGAGGRPGLISSIKWKNFDVS